MEQKVRLVVTSRGCPAPYMEAVCSRLQARQMLAAASDELGAHHVLLVLCDSEDRWTELATSCLEEDTVVVAVLPELAIEAFTRSLSLGSHGVVYVDTPSTITADVLIAAAQGEVLLPRQAAHAMARLAHRQQPATEIGDADRQLLRALSEGATIAALAGQLHYSERTVRRHLQNVYLRLGVRNRAEAITSAARLGLLD